MKRGGTPVFSQRHVDARLAEDLEDDEDRKEAYLKWKAECDVRIKEVDWRVTGDYACGFHPYGGRVDITDWKGDVHYPF